MAFKISIKKKPANQAVEDSPRFLLHKHLCTYRKARSYNTVHASDLMGRTEFCPREYALGLKYHKARPDERITTADSVTYAYGHKVEDLIIEWFAQMDKAWGDWSCHTCGRDYKFQRRPGKCLGCGGKLFEYHEVRFVSAESGASGSADLLVDMGQPKLSLIEIKSMDKESFKKLEAPLAEHRWRTNLYMRLVAESNHPMKDKVDLNVAYVLYLTKGGYGTKDPQIRKWGLLDGDWSPFKEFKVIRDDTATQPQSELAKMVKDYKQTGKLPLGICPSSLVPRAKFCTQCDSCFSPENMSKPI